MPLFNPAPTRSGGPQRSARTQVRREADRCRDEKRWAEAAALYRKHLDKHPYDFAIWVQAANCLKEAGQLEESFAAYRKAISLNSNDADVFLVFGHLLKEMGRRDEAIDAYRASLARQPHHNSALGELAVLGVAVDVQPNAPPAKTVDVKREPGGRLASVFANLRAGQGSPTKSARTAARREADRCRDEKRWAEAAALYRKHLDKHPHDAAIWVQAANCLKEAGEFEEAFAAYRRAIALNDRDAVVFLLFGHLLKEMGRRDEAVEAYRASLTLQPHHNSALGELAVLGVVLEVQSYVPPAQSINAGARSRVATTSLLKLFGLGRGSPRRSAKTAARREADRCRDEKRWAEAAALYQQHLDRHPHDVAIWVQAANCLKEAGEVEESFAAYRRAIVLDDSGADVFLLFGLLLKEMGRRDEAIEAYRTSIARNPHHNPAFRELAILEASVAAEATTSSAPATSSEPPADVTQSLIAIDQQLQNLTETWIAAEAGSDPALDLLSVLPATLTNPNKPSIFVFVDSMVDDDDAAADFFRSVSRALLELGDTVFFVHWNADARALHLAARSDLDRIGLGGLNDRSKSYRRDDEPEIAVGPNSCGEDDWLLVPGTVRGVADGSDLIAVDLIMETKRLGLRSAFVFHGAEPLRLKKHAGAVADAHERYMQALLLADAIVPVSTIATNDLTAFFVQHERAASIPLVRKIFPPSEAPGSSETLWSDYVRRIRGLITDAGRSLHQLEALYYCADTVGSPAAATADFSLRLARALSDRGVALIPAAWDAKNQQLMPSDGRVVERESSGGERLPWADWVAPGAKNSPAWLIQPNSVHGSQLAGIASFARSQGLRTAGVLHEAAARAGDSDLAESLADDRELFEALAGFDKVFAVSEHRFGALYRFLLSWRGKVGSAEHRFKVLPSPNEVPGSPRRVTPKRSALGVVRILIATPLNGSARDLILLDAAAEAAKRSASQLIFTLTGEPLQDAGQRAHLEAKIASIPQAVWELKADSDRLRAMVEAADFVILSDSDAELSSTIAESLWRGVPCVVAQTGAISPMVGPAPGLAFAELQNQDAFVGAILKLCDPEWRRHLADEAIARPIRSWDEYARGLAAHLATDRLTDTLRPVATRVRGDVYATLVNLKRRPKLSLCISTYNRAGWLGINLKNIFDQIPKPLADLEVLVVDNASRDHTSEVVEPFLSRSDFRYVRNPKNVGMLGNLAVTAQTARGEYVWILGDDDLTLSGVIERILGILNERPGIGLVYLNYGYTTEADPDNVGDLEGFLGSYNTLEPACADEFGPVKSMAAKTENFFGAIYSHVYRRDHAMRSYCQDTSGRIFSTMRACVPTTYYVLNYMMEEPAYWIGQPSLMANSNVSWQDYGALLELEHLPHAWDLAERLGADPAEVDRRRANRLWLVEMMWKSLFEIDTVGNSAYFSASRAVMRLKHLNEFERHLDELKSAYEQARERGHPAAGMPTEELFSAF